MFKQVPKIPNFEAMKTSRTSLDSLGFPSFSLLSPMFPWVELGPSVVAPPRVSANGGYLTELAVDHTAELESWMNQVSEAEGVARFVFFFWGGLFDSHVFFFFFVCVCLIHMFCIFFFCVCVCLIHMFCIVLFCLFVWLL